MGVETAIGLGLVSAGMGLYGAYEENRERRKAAKNTKKARELALETFNARREEATNAAIAGAERVQDQALQGFQSGTEKLGGQTTTAFNDIGAQSAAANRDLAEQVVGATSAESAALAAAGASGVKNTGTINMDRVKVAEANAEAFSDATTSVARQTRGAASNVQASAAISTADMAYARDDAMAAAAAIIESYSEGGDAYNVFEAQEAEAEFGVEMAEDALNDANDWTNQALTLATGAMNGAIAGISIASSFNSITAPRVVTPKVTPPPTPTPYTAPRARFA
jgi:hypothetical protein